MDALTPQNLEQLPEHLEDDEAEAPPPPYPSQGNGERLNMLHQLAKCIA